MTPHSKEVATGFKIRRCAHPSPANPFCSGCGAEAPASIVRMHEQEIWINEALQAAKAQHLKRVLTVFESAGPRVSLDGRSLLNFASNDYLGLAGHPQVIEEAARFLRKFGAGATSSRLVCGTLECHAILEQAIAEFKGYPASLVFSSGYAVNSGVVSAVVGRDDIVFADRLSHASLVDGGVLSRATVRRFAHNDMDHLETLLRAAAPKTRKLIVTESVFSMDGDLAPLESLGKLAEAYGAMLLVDEAHALGVFGPHGEGLAVSRGLHRQVNLAAGTLSKALGGAGGFVACSEAMREWLVNRARSFIYSTALPPAQVGAALAGIAILRRRSNPGASLLERAASFRRLLTEAGFDTFQSESQIVPVMIGDSEKALRIGRRLLDRGILAAVIRPPTVPRHGARLRFSITSGHTPDDIRMAAEAVAEAARQEGIP